MQFADISYPSEKLGMQLDCSSRTFIDGETEWKNPCLQTNIKYGKYVGQRPSIVSWFYHSGKFPPKLAKYLTPENTFEISWHKLISVGGHYSS